MAVTAKKYSHANYNAYRGLINDINAPATEIKVALMAETYVPDQNTHENWDQIKLNEIDPASNAPYVAGGLAIANKLFQVIGNTAVLSGDNVAWANASIAARYAVIYDATPATDIEKKLIGYIDFDEVKATSAGTFEIHWAANGIMVVEAY